MRDDGHGMPPGWRLRDLRRAPLSIDAEEQVAFVADFCTPDGCGTGAFRAYAATGALEVVARTGQTVGAEPVHAIGEGFVAIDDAGGVVVLATVGRDRWLVAAEVGRLTPLARELATVPLLIIDDLGMRKLPATAAEDSSSSSCAATSG